MKHREALLYFLLSVSFTSFRLEADVVVLRSGVRYPDVKAQPFGTAHRVVFSDGRVEWIPNSMIRSVRPAPTSWNQIQPVEPQKVPVDPPRTEPTPPQREVVKPVVVPTGFRLTPAMKSVIFPGWGQLDEGRRGTGIAFAAAGAIALQQYWTYRQRHAAAERDYNDPVPVGAIASQSLSGSISVTNVAVINFLYLASKEKTVYKLQNRGNTMIGLYGLIWAVNLMDIRQGGMPWEVRWLGLRRGPEARVQPIFYMQKDGFAAMLRISL
ncbi:MAG: hypothetical protein JNM27_10915 [Leptospirales bacterium]|nr:hypothetical protein [Leptospirales bacterium]